MGSLALFKEEWTNLRETLRTLETVYTDCDFGSRSGIEKEACATVFSQRGRSVLNQAFLFDSLQAERKMVTR